MLRANSDRRTDRRTDKAAYRVACTRLKIAAEHSESVRNVRETQKIGFANELELVSRLPLTPTSIATIVYPESKSYARSDQLINFKRLLALPLDNTPPDNGDFPFGQQRHATTTRILLPDIASQ